MTDTTGATTYTYDDLDRLIDLTDSANRAFGFAYDELNRLTRKTMANGTATDFTYDKASQLLNIVTKKTSAAEVIERIAYTYNATGTRASETRYNGTVINNRRTFTYDANDRVTQVINMQLPAQDEQFAYDLMGNWATDSRQHNAENELTQDDSGYTYEYDELGNTILCQSLSDIADRTTYTWDARNLLIAVDGPDSDTSYAYDARNRRVAKTVDGATTQYVHDGLNVLLEYDGAGALIARNTHAGLDQLCVRDEVSASTPYYICQDGISSVLSVSNKDGNILQRYRYSTFGEQQVLDANFNPIADAPLIPFAYTGREWEPEVGMYFYRARFYDPMLGRFISRDPIGLSGGDVNLYAYAGNNPILFVDPTGNITFVSGLIGGAIGAVAGGIGQFAVDVVNVTLNDGEFSSAASYAGAISGGATTGAVLGTTFNPYLAGAAGGAVGNATTQAIDLATGKRESFSGGELAFGMTVGAATGFIPGPKVSPFNSGRNSFNAIAKSTQTKLANGTIQNVSAKTSAKIAVGQSFEKALFQGSLVGSAVGFVPGAFDQETASSSGCGSSL